MIWILSNLKSDILNYLNSQKIYGEYIYFDGNGGIEFKIDENIKKVEMTKKIIDTKVTIEPPITKDKIETKKIESPVLETTFKSDEYSVNKDWKESKSLETLYSGIHNCMRCELGATRTNFVFGSGDTNADLLIIGEAPGRDEDLSGEPFVGRSGKLLTSILESIQLSREDVFIANILKCRPPNNRRPSSSEVDTCEVYLHKQIELINPKYILALGLTAADTLLKEKNVMKDIRGKVLNYRGKKLMITYHPSALLRNPNLKRPVWEDMKKLKSLLQSE